MKFHIFKQTTYMVQLCKMSYEQKNSDFPKVDMCRILSMEKFIDKKKAYRFFTLDI